jgi:hypothetical protein
VVTELKKKYAFDVEIVKKTSFGLFQRATLPKFPSIDIDGQVVFSGCDITIEQLEAAIKQRLSS